MMTQDGRERLRNFRLGSHHSDETKEKIRLKLKGRPGRKFTSEQKQHLAILKESWSDSDLSYLKENYHNTHWKILSEHLNMDRQYITTKANKLGLKKDKSLAKLSRIENNIGKSWGHHTIEHKQHMKNCVKNKILLGQFNVPQCTINRNTKLEQRFNQILQNFGLIENIDYVRNMPMKTRNTIRYPDFVYRNIIFEVDGEYWHTDKYKESRRDSELSELGYIVYHFMGSDILRNEEWTKTQVSKIISSIGMSMGN